MVQMSYSYDLDEREVLRIPELTRAETCPASWPTPGPTAWENRDAAPPLVRWIAMRNAIQAWHEAQDPDAAVDAALGHLDPVQREICDDLLRAYQRSINRSDSISFDVDPAEAADASDTYVLQSWPTAIVTHDDQTVEVLKLRTGNRSTESEEAAVLLTGGPAGARYLDLMLAADDQIPIELDEDNADEVLTRLFQIRHRIGQLARSQRPVRPGHHCYLGCPRAAYCGAYPPAKDQLPGTNARLLIVSKTALATAARCERRAAWKYLYRIPQDPDHESGDQPTVGLHVHDILAALLLEDDPQAILDEQLGAIPPDEVANVRFCVDNHLTIDTEHDSPISYRRRNLQIGVTFVVESGATPGAPEEPEQVAVVMICEVDAAGRHADGTPALIEHKTGDQALPHERDLYAVAGWRQLTAAGHPSNTVAVHHHFLRRQQGPRCDTARFDTADITDATTRLQALAEQVAAWDALDATQPRPKERFDAYCSNCLFQQRCGRHNGPSPLPIESSDSQVIR